MPVDQPRYGSAEYAERGDAIYDRDLRALIEPGNAGKFVAIDIATGLYEIDRDEIAASDRLLARVPDAQTWLRRIGTRYTRRSGRALLGDGSESVFEIHEGNVIWDGGPLRVPVDAADMVPLIGMSLLDGFELTIQVRAGGRVTIEPLP